MHRKSIIYLILSLITIVPMVFAGCTTANSPTNTTATTSNIKNPDTFIEAVIGDPATLDPAAAYDNASGEAIELVYDTLLTYDKDSVTKFVPRLATEWTISPDGKTYRFHIRQGVKFSNGDTLTPADVEYSFERGMVQDYSAGPQWLIFTPLFGVASSRDDQGNLMPLSKLTSAVNVDGEWVQFNLIQPFEPFLQILSGTWASIVDKKWCMAQGDWDGTDASYKKLNNPDSDAWPLHKIMMGTGPFIMDHWTLSTEIAFNRNDNYWNTKAFFKSVVIKTVTEWTTRKLMLQNGDADYVDVPVESYPEADQITGLTSYKNLPLVQLEALFFVYNIAPSSPFIGSGKLDGQGITTNFFTDKNVRLAFEYSFDWATYITQAMGGHGQQPDSPVVQGLSYYNANLPKYSFDKAKATSYFQAAWGGQVWANGFTMTLAYNAGNTARKAACDILAANINSLNPKFHVTSAAQQWTSYNAQWRAHNLPVFDVGWLPDYMDADDFIVPWMATYGAFSMFQGYGDAATDALIQKAEVSTNPTERQTIYNQLGQQFYNDAPGILTVQPTANRYMRDWVKGFFFNPAENNPCCNIYYLSKG